MQGSTTRVEAKSLVIGRLQQILRVAILAGSAACSVTALAEPSVTLPGNGLDFGTVNPYAVAPANVAERDLVITNNGSEPAYVTSVTYSAGNYNRRSIPQSRTVA